MSHTECNCDICKGAQFGPVRRMSGREARLREQGRWPTGDQHTMSPTAEATVRDYFKRAGLLVEDLTASEDTADLSQADTFCCVALVAQMLQLEEHRTKDWKTFEESPHAF